MKIKCDKCGNEIKINEDTACAFCGRKVGHTKNCPIYIRQFINGQVPSVYGGVDGKPIDLK